MKLITIFNYPNTKNYNELCKWWLSQAKKHAGDVPIHVWHEEQLPGALVVEDVTYEKKKRVDLSIDVPANIEKKAKHNIGFKLYNLCKEKDPFIFIDADAIIFRDIDPLVEASKAKPFICVNHQQIPKHTTMIPFEFLNSGVQVVGDPTFLNFDEIVRRYEEDDGFICPGTDQALLYSYCKEKDYDYTHEDIGSAWNSCAGYTTLSQRGGPMCAGLGEAGNPVHINHYWYEFKPWTINCQLWENRDV